MGAEFCERILKNVDGWGEDEELKSEVKNLCLDFLPVLGADYEDDFGFADIRGNSNFILELTELLKKYSSETEGKTNWTKDRLMQELGHELGSQDRRFQEAMRREDKYYRQKEKIRK